MRHVVLLAAAAGLVVTAFVMRPHVVAPSRAVAAPAGVRDEVKDHHEQALAQRREAEVRGASADELESLDRRLEIEGLELKRDLALRRGDDRTAREIDRLIESKRSRLR